MVSRTTTNQPMVLRSGRLVHYLGRDALRRRPQSGRPRNMGRITIQNSVISEAEIILSSIYDSNINGANITNSTIRNARINGENNNIL